MTKTLTTILILTALSLVALIAPSTAVADRSDFGIEVEPVEDPWAVKPGETDVEIAPARPRPQARPADAQDVSAEASTDLINSLLAIDETRRMSTRSRYLQYAPLGLVVLVAAFICLCVAVYYIHRRRHRVAEAHGKRYAKKLRKALRRSLRDEQTPTGAALSGAPLLTERRQSSLPQSVATAEASA